VASIGSQPVTGEKRLYAAANRVALEFSSISMDITTLEEVQEKLQLVLNNFTQDQNTQLPPPGSTGWRRVDLDKHAFATPSILLATLHSINGWDKYGPEEKMRWGIPATYKGVDFSFELRKFGLCLLVRDVPEADPTFVHELCRKIQSAIHVTERYLKDIAKQQADSGNVTVGNYFWRFDAAYHFFREHASAAYRKLDPPMTVRRWDPDGTPIAWSGTVMGGPREGSYYCSAMLDAYFSRLEHTLILVLPFLNFDPSRGRLLEMIGARWDEKLKQVFDLSNDRQAKQYHDRLKSIKERFRNTLAHGGFEKGITSLHFHFKGVGALPAALSRHQDSWEFQFVPLPETTFEDVTKVFDEFDAYLETGPTKYGVQFAKTGLDVCFDADSRGRYSSATASDAEFGEMIAFLGYDHARHVNMDY
jgi:hypothetical protein